MNTFPTHINTYAGGLDKDTSVNKYNNTHYQHAENFRILTEDGLTSGALQTVSGTSVLFTIPVNYFYHGHCFVRDWLVLFLRHSGADDQIYYFPLTSSTFIDPANLVVTKDFNFQENYLVQAEGRYESSLTQKVYWVDGYNNIRFINLVETGLASKPVDYFSILPVLNQVPIVIDSITQDGTLKSGLIEYATIFYSAKGAETVFSQPSRQIQITNGNLSSGFETVTGVDAGLNTDKAVNLTITNPDSTLFNRVRVVSIHYQEYNSNPKITIVGEYYINTTISVRDGGNNLIGEYTPEEFNRLKNIFSATTLSTKNNYLFAANITEDYTEVSYDARAYRFGLDGVASIDVNGDQLDIDDTLINANPLDWGVSETKDAINPYTDLASDSVSLSGSAYDYRYQRNLITSWTNVDFGTFTSTGSTITSAADLVGGKTATSNSFALSAGDIISFSAFYTENIPSDNARIVLVNGLGDISTTVLTPGANLISYTISVDETYYFRLDTLVDPLDIKLETVFTGILGGSGPNISYKFKVDSFVEDTVTTSNDRDEIPVYNGLQAYKGPDIATDPDLKGTFDNYLSPYRRIKSLSFRRDEIYRVGIEWFDKYGRPIFVDWIGDIRFPSNNDPGYSFVSFDTDKIYMHPLTLEVDVTITQELIDKEITGFRIVRCNRTEDNKTVLDSGLVGNLQEHQTLLNSYLFPASISNGYIGQFFDADFATLYNGVVVIAGGTDYTNNYKEYTSPEINYNKENISLSGTYLKASYNMDAYYSLLSFRDISTATNKAREVAILKKYSIFTQEDAITNSTFTIDESVLFSDTSYEASNNSTAYYKTINNEKVYNFSLGGLAINDNDEARGTCLILHGTDSTGIYDSANLYQAAYSSRKRNIVPYGGNSYYDRINSSYIACSDYYDISTKVLNDHVLATATGDTFLYMHEHLRTMVSQAGGTSDNSTCLEAILFPTESSFNGLLRDGSPVYKLYDSLGSSLVNLHETLGVYSNADNATLYQQTFDYYSYNKTYNNEDTIKQYTVEPLDYYLINSQTYDNKVIASEKKFNNEYIDSWTQFYFANEIELDTKYGAISKLINFNNSLLSFQSKAIAALAVEEKEVAQTNTPSALAIGYSGVLSRYDYLSTTNGSSQIKAIIQTPNQVMWYDDTNNGIYTIKSLGEPSISKVKGVSSWFNHYLSSPSHTTYCTTGYDRKFNEVLFHFNKFTANYTLVYNEITDSFVSFYTLPIITNFIYNGSKLLGVNSSSVYTHNVNTSGLLYGVYPLAKLTLIVKPQDPGMLRFDSLEWDTLAETIADVELPTNTFDKIRCYNSYQDTTLISSPDLKRRFREWRYNTIRDTGTSARLRDSYMQVDFEYQTAAFKEKLLVHDIKTHCLPNRS